MEQLLSRLNFDVRQAVHHVTGLLELLGEEPLSRNQLQYLRLCTAVADQLLCTSDDLSTLTNEETATQSLSTFNLTETVTGIAELMWALAARKQIRLSSSLDPSVPQWINADKDLMQDSLRRVLDNAIRFTSQGSVQLFVHLSPRNGESAELEFEVRDTGPGVPASVQANLALPGELPCSPGLGLKVVQKRLAGVGGQITIGPGEKGGTVAKISLPVTLPPSDQCVPAAPLDLDTQSVASKRKFRLLIAEDSEDSFLLLQTYLKGTVYHITRARDGLQAVQMVNAGTYDLIMMDANMPVMNGYEATRTIRDFETVDGRGRIPILLISADDYVRQRSLGAVVGCSGFVPKPTTKARVLEALNFFLADQPLSSVASD